MSNKPVWLHLPNRVLRLDRAGEVRRDKKGSIVRSLALLAALALVPTGAFALTMPGQAHPHASPLGERALLAEASPLHLNPWLSTGPKPLQTGSTPVPTAGTTTPTPVATETSTPVTPVPTTTPVATSTSVVTPTGTTTTYPDPVTLLRDTILVYQQIRSAHFEIVTDGDQPNIEKLHLDAVGDVTCKGPSLRGHVSAKDTLEATKKVNTLSVDFVIVKKNAYQRSKSTKNQWKKTAQSNFSQLGISADNLLLCPSSSSGSSGSGSGNNQFKNLVNLGPATFQGHAVWHIQAREVTTGSSGEPVKGTFNLYIDQKHYLPYEQAYSQTDQGVKLNQKQILTKFGEKLTIKAPKVAQAKKSTTKKKKP